MGAPMLPTVPASAMRTTSVSSARPACVRIAGTRFATFNLDFGSVLHGIRTDGHDRLPGLQSADNLNLFAVGNSRLDLALVSDIRGVHHHNGVFAVWAGENGLLRNHERIFHGFALD